jgi:hypothetical protein
MRKPLLGLLLLVAVTVAGCDWGYASVGDPQDYLLRTTDPYAQQLNAYATQHYGQASSVRLWTAWDEFGTQDSQTGDCVAPSSYGPWAQHLMTAVSDMATTAHKIPLFVISTDAGATPNNQNTLGNTYSDASPILGAQPSPTNVWPGWDPLSCAVYELLLKYPGAYIEAWNEPEFGCGYCQPPTPGLDSFTAAYYFEDMRNAVLRTGLPAHLIAGTFASAETGEGANTAENCSSAPDVPANGAKSPGYEASYICKLRDDWGSAVNSYAPSWSFHDYDDVVNGANYGCGSPGGTCNPPTPLCDGRLCLSNFVDLLSSYGLPTNDIWITEAGNNSQVGWAKWPGYHNSWWDASAGEEFLHLAATNEAAHLFWYQDIGATDSQPVASTWDYQDTAPPDWDSGLSNSNGTPRASWCVLAGDSWQTAEQETGTPCQG